MVRRMRKVSQVSVRGLRGVLATEALAAGEVAIAVPLASGLAATTAQSTACALPRAFVSHLYWDRHRG